jgi:diguanylate cyclase (GGDEF)-like protein
MEPQPDVDEITGLPNRHGAEQLLDVEWRRSARDQRPLAGLMIEIDDFGPLAQQYGADAANDCMRRVARCVRRTCHRAGDVVARYGEAQFFALLPRADDAGADSVAERLRRAVTNLAIPNVRSSVGSYVTVSIGAASTRPMNDERAADLIEVSSRRLEEAKRAGKNRRVGPTSRSSGAISSSSVAAAVRTVVPAVPDPTSGCVLVVASSGAVVAQLSELLGATGCDFQVEAAGVDAVASAQRERPSLVLLHVSLEDADAYEVCRRLKADSTTAPVPVIMIGAIDGGIDKLRVFEAGAADYLQQPFERTEVLARVEHQLEIARLQAGLRAAHTRLRELEQVAATGALARKALTSR